MAEPLRSTTPILADFSFTPVLDTSAYAAGDVLFATTKLTDFFRRKGGAAIIRAVNVIDLDDQKALFNLYFLQGNQAIGAFNAAPDIDDTEVLASLARVQIAVADYDDLGANSVAFKSGLHVPVRAAAASKDLYCAAVLGAGMTPTFTASGLRLKISYERD